MGKASATIGGLCGWVWLASIPATLALVAYAALFDGPWRWAFYSLLAGAIGKWLSRGFNDTAERTAIEKHLMGKGASKIDADDIWYQLYSAGGAEGARRALSFDEADVANILAGQEGIPEHRVAET